jgi:hypothetical protein
MNSDILAWCGLRAFANHGILILQARGSGIHHAILVIKKPQIMPAHSGLVCHGRL